MPGAVNPIRLGIVGYGKIARDQHVPAIAQDPRFTLAAIADPSSSGAVPSFSDLDALLAGSSIDAVILCQPPAYRFAAAMRAIAAGKHIFLEKPPGISVGEVAHLLHMAKARGVTLYTAWHSRMAPGVQTLKTMLSDEQIERIDIIWREDAHAWHPGQRWLWTQQGFGAFDPGINALSILTDVLAHTPRLVEATLEIPENCAAPIAARLRMTTLEGAPVEADFDLREKGRERWEMCVTTSVGIFELRAGGAQLLHDGVELDLTENREYADLYAEFADLVARCECDVDTSPLGLVADAWLAGARRSVAPHFP